MLNFLYWMQKSQNTFKVDSSTMIKWLMNYWFIWQGQNLPAGRLRMISVFVAWGNLYTNKMIQIQSIQKQTKNRCQEKLDIKKLDKNLEWLNDSMIINCRLALWRLSNKQWSHFRTCYFIGNVLVTNLVLTALCRIS